MLRSLFLILFSLFLLDTTSLRAQGDRTSNLFLAIKIQDSLLFDEGYNHCDTTSLLNLVSDNFEFYHDEFGITHSKKAFVNSFKNGLCKLPYKPRRELDKNSLEVFPLYNKGILYGAVQNGIHRFYANEPGKEEYFTSISRFSLVWMLENEKWKLVRGLSYDHQKTDKIPKPDLISEGGILKFLAENKIQCLGLGVINEGRLSEVRVFGELFKNTPAPYNTIFNVASLTKPVVSLVTLKLVSNGSWSLDEPLYKYWTDPDVISDPRHKKLTTRYILSHQTGFVNWRWLHPTKKLTFDSEPGTKYGYSGEGFEYLRKALENKFRKPLEYLADSLLFMQLGMKDTRFCWDNQIDESRFARGHDRNGKEFETYKNSKSNAADDLLTTIQDYGTFCAFVLNGASLSGSTYNEMIRSRVKLKENKYMGLGWEIYDLPENGEFALSHGGSDQGVRTQVFLFPKSKRGLIIMTNSENGDKLYVDLIFQYLQKLGKEIYQIELNPK